MNGLSKLTMENLETIAREYSLREADMSNYDPYTNGWYKVKSEKFIEKITELVLAKKKESKEERLYTLDEMKEAFGEGYTLGYCGGDWNDGKSFEEFIKII